MKELWCVEGSDVTEKWVSKGRFDLLLALAHKYASECSLCDGEGTVSGGHGFEDACEDCADILEVIAKATQP